MDQVINWFRWTWAPIAVGAVAGLFALPLGQFIATAVFEAFDIHNPVLRATSRVIARDADQIILSISVRKVRACHYLRMQAFGVARGGDMVDINLARTDRAEDGETRPVGEYNIGTWRVWPVAGSKAVVIYSNHLCDGRMVLSKVAEFPV
jgi:hypothetical protein